MANGTFVALACGRSAYMLVLLPSFALFNAVIYKHIKPDDAPTK